MRQQSRYKIQERELTFDDVASIVGMSKMAVSKRKGIENYVVSRISTGGRPRVILHPDVLSLFGITIDGDEAVANKKRAHKDKPQKISSELEEAFIEKALAVYLSQGNRKYVENSCYIAASEIWNDDYAKSFNSWQEMAKFFYKRRVTRRDRGFVGYAYRVPSWQVQWERIWKKNDIALKHVPTLRYSWLEVMEDANVIGKGFGAGQVWFFDDHIGDSFVRDESKTGFKGTLPKGLFMIDGITGAMLDYEQGEVNSTMLVFMIMRNVMRFGLPLVIGLENSRAMKNRQVDGVIESLYSDALLSFYDKAGTWFYELFPRSSSPIVRNLPNIPRSPFKARLERIFQDVKKHDGWVFPKTFTGGGKDQVQLRNSNMPIQPSKIYSLENYKATILSFLENEFSEKIRPGMFQGFQAKSKMMPTIRNVWEYYGGNQNAGTQISPDMSKFAICLYHLAKIDETGSIISRHNKAMPGKVTCKVKEREYLFIDSKINHYVGERVEIVFIPDSIVVGLMETNVISKDSGDYAALFINTRAAGLVFINICRDQVVRQVSQASVNRLHIKTVRAEMKALETGMKPDVKKSEERIVTGLVVEKTKPVEALEPETIEYEIIDDEILKLLEL